MDGPCIRTLALPCPRCLRVTLHYVYPFMVRCALCLSERWRPDDRRNGDGKTET